MTVTSQQRGLPSYHGIRDRPSGLLPSDLDRPLGSLVTGIPADTNARDQLIKGLVSCRSTRSWFVNEAVYAVCIYHFSTLTLMWHAYRQAQTDTDRDSNAGRRKLSVGQKASHHCVRRLSKRKPAEEVNSFVIPLTLDRQALQDGPKTVVWEGDLPGGGQR